MQYLLMLYENEKLWANMTPEQGHAVMKDYDTFTKSIVTSGHYKGGNPLDPTHTAKTVRVRDGKRETTDGPFAETREQLGGYYLIDAASMDEALDIAARVPGARTGSIEVRAIMQMPSGVGA